VDPPVEAHASLFEQARSRPSGCVRFARGRVPCTRGSSRQIHRLGRVPRWSRMWRPRESMRLVQSAPASSPADQQHRRGPDGNHAPVRPTSGRGARRRGTRRFVLKKGLAFLRPERVKVYGRGGVPMRSGRGLFAEALAARLPSAPDRGRGRLSDPGCARISSNASSRIGGSRLCFALRWSMGTSCDPRRPTSSRHGP